MTIATFTASAPEFSWTLVSCGATHGNCFSEQVVDARPPLTGQGVILAAYSPKTHDLLVRGRTWSPAPTAST